MRYRKPTAELVLVAWYEGPQPCSTLRETARYRLATRWRGHERRSGPVSHHFGWNRMPPSKRRISEFM
jgi:hypothetical protein